MIILYVDQRFSNGAPQGLPRCATLAFRKFTTRFLDYSLFSGIYKIGYDDHLEVVRYPTRHCNYCSHILGTKPFSWHDALKKKKKKKKTKKIKKQRLKRKKTETNEVPNLAYCFDFPCKVRPFVSQLVSGTSRGQKD